MKFINFKFNIKIIMNFKINLLCGNILFIYQELQEIKALKFSFLKLTCLQYLAKKI